MKIDDKMNNLNEGTVYSLILESKFLPFVVEKPRIVDLEKQNEILQKFVRLMERKFDAIWYIGTDILGDEVYERFMFHHGGFMEISLKGKIRCYLSENKIDKLKNAIYNAGLKLSGEHKALHLIGNVIVGKRLISVRDSIRNIKEE